MPAPQRCSECDAELSADSPRGLCTKCLFSLGLSESGESTQVTASKNLALTSGKTFGPYQILCPLGAGGMGEVYRARDTRLGREVGIKVLRAAFSAHPDRLRRFEQEARAASALNHPNIITIHEIGKLDGDHFMATEFIDGPTLRQLITKVGMEIGEALAISIQTADALAAAHAAGIVHRDIKPENIMVRPDGYVKVLDFGLAKLTERQASTAETDAPIGVGDETKPGVVMGTVKYMSPEQARGLKVDPRTDIFSLGVVTYEMITGCVPFGGATMSDVIASILRSKPRPLASYSREIPDELEQIVTKALAKGCDERYQTIKDLALDLKKLKEELEFKARLENAGQSAPSNAAGLVVTAPARHTVGREKERAELRVVFESVGRGRGLLLGVSGEPGIGKTTLVEDFLAELSTSKRPGIIARGHCSERLAGTEAYLPFLEALDNLLRSEARESIAGVMKRLAPTWYVQVAPLSAENPSDAHLIAEAKAGSQERMKRELGAFFQEVTSSRPIVLFFDDLHWADVSTIDLLAYLATKFQGLRLLIVATYRPSDLLLGAHPLLQVKPDWQARGLCRELALDFLSAKEIERYLALEFPEHRFPAQLPALIQTKTEGSPLFMADLVRDLRNRGVIAQEQGRWVLARSVPEVERDLPESVRGMIERKIAQLGEDERKLLMAASVQGYEFDSAVVAKVAGMEPDEVEERLETLERVHAFVKLVEEKEFPDRTLTLRYRFVHVLYQNAIYGSLRATRRATMSAAVAEKLLGFYGEQSGKVASELAALFSSARDFAKAVEFYLLAARQAAKVYANAEGAALAGRGLELLKSLPDAPQRAQQELSLQVTRGMALSIAHGYTAPEVGESYARARELCQQMGETPELFPVLFGLWVFYLPRGELSSAREISEQLLEKAKQSGDRVQLTAAHLALGNTLLLMGELVSGRENMERSISFREASRQQTYQSLFGLDPGVFSRAEGARSVWLLGYPDQARQWLQEAVALAAESSDPRNLAFAQMLGATIDSYLRECGQVRKWMEACVAHCAKHDFGHHQWWACALGGWAMAEQGETAEGISLIQKSLATHRLMGVRVISTELLTLLAQVLAKSGKTDEGLATLAETVELASQMAEGFFNAETQRVKGELLLQTNAERREIEAEACFQQAITIAREQSAKSWELRAVTSLARLWQKQGKREEARTLLSEIYGWFTEGFDTADLKDAKALLAELS